MDARRWRDPLRRVPEQFVGHDKAWPSRNNDSHAVEGRASSRNGWRRRTIPPLPAGEGRGEGETSADPRITRVFVALTLTLSLSLRERELQATRVGFSTAPRRVSSHDDAWPSRNNESHAVEGRASS